MTAGAEIGLLGDGRPRADLNFTKRVGIGTVTQAGAIVQC